MGGLDLTTAKHSFEIQCGGALVTLAWQYSSEGHSTFIKVPLASVSIHTDKWAGLRDYNVRFL